MLFSLSDLGGFCARDAWLDSGLAGQPRPDL
ncbi:hypothetical protein L682_19685 [Aquipseudomonas alcaligenes OT 69]|nr:hypothetical protein L682_19685 [Pseudomonas alcaligenes OT 69]